MKAKVHVTLKNGVLDPQGQAILKALANNNIKGINSVRQGKFFELELDNKADAEAQVEEACRKLLANSVIENYDIELIA
ncbi:MAG: phosphoribosylformylglycinamidine synthase [Alphaproteobacteria bacterium CG11_big_fil_rev_8_21_14_0_20_44_7]|nr:MAG: phosphoribosylformylglycinamidine synthase [Alphaproteobacteria bacterium CG11_big_fil_rev_8_21_14_0_20_44_7]